MAKQGEIDYPARIGAAGRQHAAFKPFSDDGCGQYLVDLGPILRLLPQPPARLLDLGCGTGWTTRFFARRGYDVTGQDISPHMIDIANQTQSEEGLVDAQFVVGDYEEPHFGDEFDAVVFFDSLHHALDEHAAIRAAYLALKRGGVCITAEPGWRHSRSADARRAVAQYNVTEKDMPPSRIIAAAKAAGFRQFHVHPRLRNVFSWLYDPPPRGFGQRLVRRAKVLAYLLGAYRLNGFVVMMK